MWRRFILILGHVLEAQGSAQALSRNGSTGGYSLSCSPSA